jgi:hypothetical protein
MWRMAVAYMLRLRAADFVHFGKDDKGTPMIMRGLWSMILPSSLTNHQERSWYEPEANGGMGKANGEPAVVIPRGTRKGPRAAALEDLASFALPERYSGITDV